MFDLSIPKLLVLAVIALVIFGPNELPKIARQAGTALRDLRKIAEGAKNDLRVRGTVGRDTKVDIAGYAGCIEKIEKGV